MKDLSQSSFIDLIPDKSKYAVIDNNFFLNLTTNEEIEFSNRIEFSGTIFQVEINEIIKRINKDKPITFANCYFTYFFLDSLELNNSLRFGNCHFDQGFYIYESTIKANIHFTNCFLRNEFIITRGELNDIILD